MYFSAKINLSCFVGVQPCQEAKSKLQFYLQLFAVLFRCLDPSPETVEKDNHPVSALTS